MGPPDLLSDFVRGEKGDRVDMILPSAMRPSPRICQLTAVEGS